ncbi:hypothetical protein [Treponema sp.]|uniref:hypothetical protein n=1 Tax=Treponema sp. TaxID=166 RepID=UPI00298EC2BA|nr:hypothetical protein [Treponema sp.]
MENLKAHYHLPGLFEFYDLYRIFLELFYSHRDWFYPWCDIGSIYGAPRDCLWGGGRCASSDAHLDDVISLVKEFKFSPRLTLSNSLLKSEHLKDKKCNMLCHKFAEFTQVDSEIIVGAIVHSEILLEYLRKNFPSFYLVSSTTKVITEFSKFSMELERPEFKYVVPDFRLNKSFENLNLLSQDKKDKVEFLCNECCSVGCTERKLCYENVSRRNLGQDVKEHRCSAPKGEGGYRFSLAMKNPSFISIDDIKDKYLKNGFTNFKIEGRALGSAVVLEILLYYMTKPEHQLEVREAVYLDSMLDLF